MVNILDNEYVEVQKITENQIRAKKYKVKNEELIILKRFKEGENRSNISDEEYFSAEEVLEKDRETCDKTVEDSVAPEKHLKQNPKRLEYKTKRFDKSTCIFCIENNLQVIHHCEDKCWRRKNFFSNSDRNISFKVDSETETSDEEYEPDQDNELSLNSEGSIPLGL